MRAVEAGAAATRFVQDADQVDDHVAAAESLAQHGRVVYVGIVQLGAGQHQQVAVAVAVAGQDPHTVAVADQPADERRTDEAGAAEDADRQWMHATPARAAREPGL